MESKRNLVDFTRVMILLGALSVPLACYLTIYLHVGINELFPQTIEFVKNFPGRASNFEVFMFFILLLGLMTLGGTTGLILGRLIKQKIAAVIILLTLVMLFAYVVDNSIPGVP